MEQVVQEEQIFQEPQIKLPLELKGRWVRFKEKIDYSKANCNVIIGGKETGKSALNENLATHYVESSSGCKIFDLFGSRDNEGLAWCRSPYKDGVLLVAGDSVDISSSWDYKHLHDLRFSDFEKYKVIITVPAFYSNLKEEYHGIGTLVDLLWKRTSWTSVWYLLIRETANLIYSRLVIGDNQAEAKAYLIYILREARHVGFAVGADAIRYMSVDIDLRHLADYTFLKAVGAEGLPDSLKWLYHYFKPLSLMRMPTNRFVVVSRRGTIGRGKFECPPWHKKEKEDLLRLLNISLDRGEPVDYGDQGKVGDFEHADIVRQRAEGRSYRELAQSVKRSSRTVNVHVKEHNNAIKSLGSCERCKRVKSPMEKVIVA